MLQLIQQQPKNMMVQLGQQSNSLNTARGYLAGALELKQQHLRLVVMMVQLLQGATEEYDGTNWTTSPVSLNTARVYFSRSRYSNSSFSFWWYYDLLQEQQKNIMEQLGQQSCKFKYSKICFSRSRNTNSCISFWW
jgi:hypothetical protein